MRPSFIPSSQPITPPTAAPTQAQKMTGEMSSLCLAANTPAATTTGSPGPIPMIQLAHAATASPT